jgi:DDB1- and CUL4-associated factor 8
LSNEKPKHKWSAVREIFYRQNGLTGNGRQNLSGISGSMFQKRVCGSLNSVERLELMFKLQKHRGCVNSLSFHPSGQLLASGSDDLKVILWKWASNEIALAYESGHHSNIFQAKFFGTPNEIHLITTGRDGQVRHATVPSSGGKPYSRALYKHIGAVHKTAINPNNPTEVLTAGEDAHVM